MKPTAYTLEQLHLGATAKIVAECYLIYDVSRDGFWLVQHDRGIESRMFLDGLNIVHMLAFLGRWHEPVNEVVHLPVHTVNERQPRKKTLVNRGAIEATL